MAEQGGGGGGGGLITGLGAFGRQGIGNSAGFGLNQISASRAWDTYKKSLQRGPTYMMRGLEKAGINPIIAAGGGINASGPGRSIMQAPTNAGNVQPASTAMKQSKLIGAQVNATDAMRDKTNADASLVRMNERLQALNLPAAEFNAAFNLTTEGRALLRQARINDAIPNSWSGMTGKGLYNLTTDPQVRAAGAALRDIPGPVHDNFNRAMRPPPTFKARRYSPHTRPPIRQPRRR